VASGAAARVVNGFDHPPSLFPWLGDPAACETMIEKADAERAVEV
jgi:hypothetical protein